MARRIAGVLQEALICRQLLELSKKLSIPWVVTNNVHYGTPAKRIVHDVLTCLKHKESSSIPPMTELEETVANYQPLGLITGPHPMMFYREWVRERGMKACGGPPGDPHLPARNFH